MQRGKQMLQKQQVEFEELIRQCRGNLNWSWIVILKI